MVLVCCVVWLVLRLFAGWLFVLCGVSGHGTIACDLVCYVLLAGWLLVLLIVLFMFAGYKDTYAFIGWFRYVFICLLCCC